MMYDIILSRENNKYIARAKDWPEVVVKEDTRDQALDQIKLRLVDYLTNQIEIIQVELPLSAQKANPWLKHFGRFKDDPTFDDLQAEIAAYRKEIDQATEQSGQ